MYIFPLRSFAFKVTTAPPAQIMTKIVPKITSDPEFEENDKVLWNLNIYFKLNTKNYTAKSKHRSKGPHRSPKKFSSLFT